MYLNFYHGPLRISVTSYPLSRSHHTFGKNEYNSIFAQTINCIAPITTRIWPATDKVFVWNGNICRPTPLEKSIHDIFHPRGTEVGICTKVNYIRENR